MPIYISRKKVTDENTKQDLNTKENTGNKTNDTPKNKTQETTVQEEKTNDDINNNILNKEQSTKKLIPNSQQMRANCEEVQDILANFSTNPPQNDEELDKLFDRLNDSISKVCHKGVMLDKVGSEEKSVFQNYIDFTNHYNSRKNSAEKMKSIDAGTEDYAEYKEQYNNEREELSGLLKNMSTNTSEYIKTHTPEQETTNDDDLQK